MKLELFFSLRDDELGLVWTGSNISETMGDGADGKTVSSATSEVTETFDTDVLLSSGGGGATGNGPGMLVLANLSTTAAETIDVGFATGDYEITLAASGSGINWALLPLKSTQTGLFHLAASGTPRLFYKVFERGS